MQTLYVEALQLLTTHVIGSCLELLERKADLDQPPLAPLPAVLPTFAAPTRTASQATGNSSPTRQMHPQQQVDIKPPTPLSDLSSQMTALKTLQSKFVPQGSTQRNPSSGHAGKAALPSQYHHVLPGRLSLTKLPAAIPPLPLLDLTSPADRVLLPAPMTMQPIQGSGGPVEGALRESQNMDPSSLHVQHNDVLASATQPLLQVLQIQLEEATSQQAPQAVVCIMTATYCVWFHPIDSLPVLAPAQVKWSNLDAKLVVAKAAWQSADAAIGQLSVFRFVPASACVGAPHTWASLQDEVLGLYPNSPTLVLGSASPDKGTAAAALVAWSAPQMPGSRQLLQISLGGVAVALPVGLATQLVGFFERVKVNIARDASPAHAITAEQAKLYVVAAGSKPPLPTAALVSFAPKRHQHHSCPPPSTSCLPDTNVISSPSRNPDSSQEEHAPSNPAKLTAGTSQPATVLEAGPQGHAGLHLAIGTLHVAVISTMEGKAEAVMITLSDLEIQLCPSKYGTIETPVAQQGANLSRNATGSEPFQGSQSLPLGSGTAHFWLGVLPNWHHCLKRSGAASLDMSTYWITNKVHITASIAQDTDVSWLQQLYMSVSRIEARLEPDELAAAAAVADGIQAELSHRCLAPLPSRISDVLPSVRLETSLGNVSLEAEPLRITCKVPTWGILPGKATCDAACWAPTATCNALTCAAHVASRSCQGSTCAGYMLTVVLARCTVAPAPLVATTATACLHISPCSGTTHSTSTGVLRHFSYPLQLQPATAEIARIEGVRLTVQPAVELATVPANEPRQPRPTPLPGIAVAIDSTTATIPHEALVALAYLSTALAAGPLLPPTPRYPAVHTNAEHNGSSINLTACRIRVELYLQELTRPRGEDKKHSRGQALEQPKGVEVQQAPEAPQSASCAAPGSPEGMLLLEQHLEPASLDMLALTCCALSVQVHPKGQIGQGSDRTSRSLCCCFPIFLYCSVL